MSLAVTCALLAGCGGTAGGVDTSDAGPAEGPPGGGLAAVSACDGASDHEREGPTWVLRLVTPGPDYSLAADGTVIEVARRDIYASVEDYRTWRVSPAAVDAALEAAGDPMLSEAVDDLPGAEGLWGQILHPCARRTPLDPRGLAVVTAMSAITDEAARLTEPQLWQPDELWLDVLPADRLGTPNEPTDPFEAWPLPGTIADHVVGHDVYRPDVDDGVPVQLVCLRGGDVAPLWQLQQPGIRRTWIRLEDADGLWEVSISPTWPGYRPSGDPCGIED